MDKNACARIVTGKRMENDFDALKPVYAPKSFYNWNVEELRDYKE
tara:strand:- start:66 stop:200 length:135 start_codon:yes stop_codon:yes gene_type:complete